MEMLKMLVLLVCLGTASLWDLKYKLIPLPVLLVLGGAGTFLRIVECTLLTMDMLWCMLIGAGCVLLSVASKGAVGMGDALLILGMGFWMSSKMLLQAEIMSLFAAGIVALGLLCCGKRRQDQIPFAPFLMSGTLLLYLGEWL